MALRTRTIVKGKTPRVALEIVKMVVIVVWLATAVTAVLGPSSVRIVHLGISLAAAMAAIALILFGGIRAKTAAARAAMKDRLAGEGRDAFLAFIGSPPDRLDIQGAIDKKTFSRVTVTGLACVGRTIFIVDNGVAAEVPWDAVRGWGWNLEEHKRFQYEGTLADDFGRGEVVIEAAQDVLARVTPVLNAATAVLAKGRPLPGQPDTGDDGDVDDEYDDGDAMTVVSDTVRSGFFVKVDDVAAPVWQFQCSDEATLRTWHGVFNRLSRDATVKG
jgi:hypothetical protein